MSEFLVEATKWLDDHSLFREAVTRTARETGFASPLIEKDLFCSVTLAVLEGQHVLQDCRRVPDAK